MAKINANYEALYILKPDLTEEQNAALIERFKGIVEANGKIGRASCRERVSWYV